MQKLFVEYTTIKNILVTIPSYYVPQGDGGYFLFAIGDSFFIESRILGSETTNKSDFESNYKSDCVETYSGDDALILGNIANKVPLVQLRTSTGLVRTSSEKSDSSKQNFFSHNWSDKTTWYTESVKVTDEVATNSGNDILYNLANDYVIDVYHGKTFGEDFLKDSSNNTYRVIVKVNDVVKTEQDPHYSSGGDYTINYTNGTVTFLSALDVADVVKVTYYYATGSSFYIRPAAGYKLNIIMAEVQFAKNIVMNDSIIFQPYGYVDVFAPQYMPGIPSGTKIPLGDPVVYKTITDLQADAFRAYATYPVMSASNWRGLDQELIIFDWDYTSSTPLRSDYGMEIKMSLQHDAVAGGSYATASFYCTTETL
jgi:hypothetical protein